MHKRITFRHGDQSEVIEQYANQQLEKIVEFLANERSPVYIDLVLEPAKLHEHSKVELRVKSPNYDLISTYEHTGVKFYDVLDRVIDTMYRELHEHKRKLVDERKHSNHPDDFGKNRPD